MKIERKLVINVTFSLIIIVVSALLSMRFLPKVQLDVVLVRLAFIWSALAVVAATMKVLSENYGPSDEVKVVLNQRLNSR